MATVEALLPAVADPSAEPLAAGDRRSREDFLRLWTVHPNIKRAELIGGIVYLPSPLSLEHGEKEADVGTWLGMYRLHTPGTSIGHNVTSFLLEDTAQPDLFLRILPEFGGASFEEGRYLAGRPELLTEICTSSAAYDLHQKFDLYQAAKIPEYLAVLLHEQQIRWHVLVGNVYQQMPPDADKIWRSRVFPGLWLDGEALLAGNMTRVASILDEGLRSSEHQAFV